MNALSVNCVAGSVRCGSGTLKLVARFEPGQDVDAVDPGGLDDRGGVGLLAAEDRGNRLGRVELAGGKRTPEALGEACLGVVVDEQGLLCLRGRLSPRGGGTWRSSPRRPSDSANR